MAKRKLPRRIKPHRWTFAMESAESSFERLRASSGTPDIASRGTDDHAPITAFFANRETGAKHQLVYGGWERDIIARAVADVREALEAGYDVSIVRLWPDEI